MKHQKAFLQVFGFEFTAEPFEQVVNESRSPNDFSKRAYGAELTKSVQSSDLLSACMNVPSTAARASSVVSSGWCNARRRTVLRAAVRVMRDSG